MPIAVQCPKCQRNATMPDSTVGKKVKCGCGTSFLVQSTPQFELLQEPPQLHPDPQQLVSERPVAGQLHRQSYQCESCQQTVDGFWIPDGRFICPNCAPPAVYQRWVTEWAPIQKQIDKEAKIKKREMERQESASRKASDVAQAQESNQNNKVAASSMSPRLKRALTLAAVGGFFSIWLSITVYRFVYGTPTMPAQAPEIQPSAPTAPSDELRSAAKETIHLFERSEADKFVRDKNKWRALIFITMEKSERREEAVADMLYIANTEPILIEYFFTHEPNNELFFYKEWSFISNAAQKTFISVWSHYDAAQKACIARGTTIEAEAKKKLGE